MKTIPGEKEKPVEISEWISEGKRTTERLKVVTLLVYVRHLAKK